MERITLDSVSKLFGERRMTRRAAIQAGGATAAAGALAAAGVSFASAQDGTPQADVPMATAAPENAASSVPYLFVQSFESGSIMPTEGMDGRFTVTLQHGLGQTLYFSDRPERVVGSSPTPQFLEGLGFPEDNPPNAAMVLDDGAGGVNIAVVELFNPMFDPVSPGVTYEIEVLQDYQSSLEMGFTEAPSDLSALPETFGATHLFIDDCPDAEVYCVRTDMRGNPRVGSFGQIGHCYSWGDIACITCGSQNFTGAVNYWTEQCNSAFSGECEGNCYAQGICSAGINC